MIRQLIESAIHRLTKRRLDTADDRGAALLARARQLEGEHRPSDAAGIYREILGRQPQHLAALSALGGVLCELNRHDEALRCYEAALAIEPDDRALLFKLGNLQWLMGRLTDADESYRQILAIAPDDAHALNNLGLVRQEEGDSLEAERFFRAALQSDPGYLDAHSNLLLCLNYQDRYPPETVYREHVGWAEEAVAGIAPRTLSYRGRPHDRIRVGYISPNLKTHSVAYFFEPLLRHHDPARFEIFCYDDANRPDAVTARLRSFAEHWRIAAGASNASVERMILQDEVDILVELAGHTADNRLRMLARRVAPVQATYLGYPNTTGVPAIDYRLTDGVADPAGITDRFHSETLARLPSAWCYAPPADAPPVVERVGDAAGMTFGSFNKLAKLSDRAVATWSRVLQAVPGSSLLLKCSALNDAEVAEQVKQRFVRHGVAGERIRMLGFARTNRDHMALYGQVDIGLDTFPYCGTTTTCEALYMGVPVVTLLGGTHVGRVGASLLSALGHAEWIANGEDEFVDVARELARDAAHLARLRQGLRAEMTASLLMDGMAFTRAVEERYREFVARH